MIAETFFINPVNWNSPVNFSFKRQTSVKRGVQGNESRSKLTQYPVRSINFSSQFSNDVFGNSLLRNFFFNIEKVWGVPLFHEATFLTSQTSIGEATLSCDTSYRNLSAPQLIIVTYDHFDYEVKEILSVDINTITTTTQFGNDYPVGSVVYPLLQSRISTNSSANFKKETDRLGSIQLTFTEAYEHYFEYNPGSNVFPTYNGYSVFNLEPNWISQIPIDITKNFQIMKFLGVDQSYCYQLLSDVSLEAEFDLWSRQSCYEFESFFNLMAGRWATFWLPTWQSDIVITEAIGSSDTILTIKDIDYANTWLTNDLVGRIIFIKSFDGSEAYRYITSAPTNTTITINSSLGFSVAKPQLRSIVSCFLLPVRFDIDDLEFKYYSVENARLSLKFFSISEISMSPIP